MDLENQDSEKPERRSKWSLVIVVSGRTHEMNCLDSCKAELETVAEKNNNKQTNKQTNKKQNKTKQNKTKNKQTPCFKVKCNISYIIFQLSVFFASLAWGDKCIKCNIEHNHELNIYLQI